jgi:hypothetical protein
VLTQRARPAPSAGDLRALAGSLVRCTSGCESERSLDMRGLRVFASSVRQAATVRAEVAGYPFVVEQAIGDGRLVAVADGRPLSNQQVGYAGGSLLALDLVRTYGVPDIDETTHGLGESASLLAVLGPERTVLLALASLVLASASILYLRRLPPRSIDEPPQPEPTLHAFVHSLATLYRNSTDYAAIFAAYRHGALQRMMAKDARMPRRFEVRIERDADLDPVAREWLSGARAPRSAAELLRAVRAVERYTMEVR